MDVNEKLKQAFKFTDDDLRENRAGKLSAAQLARLRGNANRNFLILLAILLSIGILTMLSLRGSSNEMLIMLLCLSVPAITAFALTFGAVGRVNNFQTLEKRAGQAYLSTPPVGYAPPLPMEKVSLVMIRRGFFDTLSMYHMVVDDTLFNLNMEEHEALTPAVYTVYFLPQLRNRIVSLEIIALTDDRTRRMVDLPASDPLGLPTLSAGQSSIIHEPDSEDLKG